MNYDTFCSPHQRFAYCDNYMITMEIRQKANVVWILWKIGSSEVHG